MMYVISSEQNNEPFILYHSLGSFSRCQIVDIFPTFSQKTGFDISCNFFPLNEMLNMFSGKNKKKYQLVIIRTHTSRV